MVDFGKMKPQWRPAEADPKRLDEEQPVKDLDVTEREADDVKAGFGGWNPKRPFMG
jgi:hypothetical protein